MLNPNLNRQIRKILPDLKVSFFLLVWNGVFHSLTLSTLLYWSFTSPRVPELSRMSTLNQFWTENQILFAAICTVSGAFFFKDQLTDFIRGYFSSRSVFWVNFLRGIFFATALVVGLIWSKRYEFLGVSSQFDLNFLSSYAWIFRALVVFLFVISSEFLTRVALPTPWLGTLTRLAIYWIWFTPTLPEAATLVLLFLLFTGAWSAAGFTSALFVMTHAVFGLPFFENEFSGLLQLKVPLESMVNADYDYNAFLQNHYLQATLLILLVIFRTSRMTTVKSSVKIFQERKSDS